MRNALFGLLCLGLSLGCTRAPSSVPLGGKEWLPPEAHFDRKAPGSDGESQASAAPSAPPAASPVASAAAPSASVPVSTPAPSGELEFAFVVLGKNEAITLRTHYSGRARVALGPAGTQSIEIDANERIEIKVLEASSDAVRELDVEYAESRSSARFGELPMDNDALRRSNAGKRYRVRLSGGSATVTSTTKGSIEPDEDKGVLFDLASIIGYVPLVKARVPVTLTAGWRARVPSGDVAQVFGSVAAVHFEEASLSLLGRDPARPDLASFDCTLPVRVEHDGIALFANLRGTFTVRPRDSRPVSVRLRGPLEAKGKLPFGDASVITGSLEVNLEHAYRR